MERRLALRRFAVRVASLLPLVGLIYWFTVCPPIKPSTADANPIAIVALVLSIIAAIFNGFTWFSKDFFNDFSILKWKLAINMSGVIPQESRSIIIEARKEFESVYLVSEAGKWGFSPNGACSAATSSARR